MHNSRVRKIQLNPTRGYWRFCVAPMMEWTDRHCRYFHRQLTRHARLYTEMLTTGTLLHGDAARHLAFDGAEHPVALQLGGSEPEELRVPRNSGRVMATMKSTSIAVARRSACNAARSARV